MLERIDGNLSLEKMMGCLDGKVAFISGASSGIGEATAIFLLKKAQR
jgi:NADP-dependent 3-hydroxy acid dehydrogenase YdfG